MRRNTAMRPLAWQPNVQTVNYIGRTPDVRYDALLLRPERQLLLTALSTEECQQRLKARLLPLWECPVVGSVSPILRVALEAERWSDER